MNRVRKFLLDNEKEVSKSVVRFNLYIEGVGECRDLELVSI